MANIPITGFPSNYLVPSVVGEIVFAQGPSNASSGDRGTIMVAPMSSAGKWDANSVYTIKTEQDAIDGAGVGSPMHRAIKRFLTVNKSSKLYALPYAATSGGAQSADGYVKISGTATSAGIISITIVSTTVQAAVSVGDTASEVGAQLVAGINQQQYLPVTAAWDASKGVLLVAKIAGASQGTSTSNVISYHGVQSKAAGLTISQPGSYLGEGAGATAGVDGSTTELANLTAALATIDPTRYYYVAITCPGTDAAEVLATHISTKSDPIPGLRSISIFGGSETVANSATIAVARNYERLNMINQPKPEDDIAAIVGNYAAIRNKYEQLDIAYNFDNFSGKDWLVPATWSTTNFPDLEDINDALSDGVTLIASRLGGVSYIPKTVTTRSKDSTGLIDDWRALETHRISVADAVLDKHLAQHAVTYQNFKLKEDELNLDGTVNLNQRKIPGVLTPSQYKPFVINLLTDFYNAGKIRNLEASLESILVDIDPENGGRLEVGYDINAISLLHQTSIRIAETSAG